MLLLSFDHQDHISEIRGLCSTYENPCAIFSNYKDISTSSFILYKKKLQHEKWKKSTRILVFPNTKLCASFSSYSKEFSWAETSYIWRLRAVESDLLLFLFTP